MAITALPTAPARSQPPATFVTNMDNFLAALPTLVTEVNTTTGLITSLAAGGAVSIPYTFSTTTTDSDPGNGFLRLDNATQNTAVTIRADLLGADGNTYTTLLDTFATSTSTITGTIRLSKVSDTSKFLVFNVSATATPSGYRNITVANVTGSSASPFVNGDSIVLFFARTGDKGTTGNNGAAGALVLLATLTPTAAAAVNALSTFTASYDSYWIVGEGLCPATNDSLKCQLAVANSLDTSTNYFNLGSFSTSASASGVSALLVTATSIGASGLGLNFEMLVSGTNSAFIKSVGTHSTFENTTALNFQTESVSGCSKNTGALTGIGFFWSGAANFKAQGKIRIYGISNT